MEKPIKSKIGGQALIEGIMMRGIDKVAMACRLPDGTIDVETDTIKPNAWYNKTPFIRGVFNFCQSLYTGMRYTIKSAEKQTGEEGETTEKPSKFELWLEEKFGDKIEKHFTAILIVISILSVAASIAVFKFVPLGLSSLLKLLNAPAFVMTISEGLIKFLLLCGYMYIVSLTESMKRLFSYHGAEHKSIACYENGLPLTVENVRTQTRFHPRCGTSFILLVVILSIIIGMFLPWDNIWMRWGLQILMLIPESSLAYELIKIAGRYDNIITRIISAPGIALQHITTKEPDDKMIEVGIAAIEAVIPDNRDEDQW
ncbi:MAG: DUF1385 domain-containing protein [Ruminococcus sp.]|jgi:uncharacterized protein YqhQ|nr:DUF1385 domain-containing protein [Ruminococcus sp.]